MLSRFCRRRDEPYVVLLVLNIHRTLASHWRRPRRRLNRQPLGWWSVGDLVLQQIDVLSQWVGVLTAGLAAELASYAASPSSTASTDAVAASTGRIATLATPTDHTTKSTATAAVTVTRPAIARRPAVPPQLARRVQTVFGAAFV